MTSNQYRSHAEQVEAARKEFEKLWPKIYHGQKWCDIDSVETETIEHYCWSTFLHAKGLA